MVKLIQIARGKNRQADSLATLASSLIKDVPQLIKVEVMKEPNIDVKMNILTVVIPEPCCMDLIIEFLAKDHVSKMRKRLKEYAE